MVHLGPPKYCIYMKETKSPKKKFLTRIDIAILICIIAVLAAVGVIVKLVLQKDTYITVELLASGGEWWWGVPPPYYWNGRDVKAGMKEYDQLSKPIVEVLDVVKYNEDNRSFMWIKARLKVTRNYLTKEYIFQQETLQIGRTINISPGNVSLIGNVVGIEGVGSIWKTQYIQLTSKAQMIKPWESDAVHVGDTVKDNNGDLVVEVLDKQVDGADIMTTDWQGNALHKKSPILQDMTLTMKVRVIKNAGQYFFNYYQPIAIGTSMRVQFASTAIDSNIQSFIPLNN